MPNSSASISVSTSAAQLIATNGPCRRGPSVVNLARDQLLADAALAFDQHGEVGVRDALDPLAQQPHRLARSDQRRRAIALGRRQGRGRAGQPLRLEQHAGNARGRFEQLAGPVVGPGARVERRFEHDLPALLFHRHEKAT